MPALTPEDQQRLAELKEECRACMLDKWGRSCRGCEIDHEIVEITSEPWAGVN
jgi:hypothetical protein